jgi:hypothetical protein
MGVGWMASAALLVLIYFYAHYFFASTTAHVTAMFAAFFAAGVALGTPPMLLGLLLAFSSSLNVSLTHYATGTVPIIFGSGYATLNEWWIAGWVMSVVNIAILVTVGGVWWSLLGYLEGSLPGDRPAPAARPPAPLLLSGSRWTEGTSRQLQPNSRVAWTSCRSRTRPRHRRWNFTGLKALCRASAIFGWSRFHDPTEFSSACISAISSVRNERRALAL